ncbi:RNA polymerase sigma factor [Sphingobacterium suaedae]|uniref:RNA polymerase sigma factor n=1 Tax=Sphingobacterium suaedae TaxID=1686402 RepID=A0ABW5KL60_9SPHI
MKNSDQKINRFHTIYNMYWRELYHFALKSVKDAALAEDLLHDVFLKLLKSKLSSDDDENIKHYLFKSLRNMIIDHYRKNKLRLKLETDIPTWYDQHENQHLEVTIRREIEEFIEHRIGKFPPQMRRVVLLNTKQGLTDQQIAKKLLISDKTVRNQLSIANQKLKMALEKFLK